MCLAGVLLAFAGACPAQWELGAAAGYGLYRNASVYALEGKAAAGVRNRFALSVVLSEERFERIGGELRYTYQDGDPFLRSGGVQTNLQGQSHALHYDVLVHFRRPEARLRPYFAAGVGAKLFVVTGPPNPTAPLGGIARLTTHDDLRWLATPGFGLKWYARRGLCVRVDFRDYITPFPKKLIAPAPLATPRGFLQQFTPLVGVSYVFPE
jgi:hypothetical protein